MGLKEKYFFLFLAFPKELHVCKSQITSPRSRKLGRLWDGGRGRKRWPEMAPTLLSIPATPSGVWAAGTQTWLRCHVRQSVTVKIQEFRPRYLSRHTEQSLCSISCNFSSHFYLYANPGALPLPPWSPSGVGDSGCWTEGAGPQAWLAELFTRPVAECENSFSGPSTWRGLKGLALKTPN